MTRLVLLLALATGVTPVRAQTASACRPAPAGFTAAALLARADSAMQVPAAAGRVLRWSGARSVLNDYQSDRTYPPFFAQFQSEEGWYDPATGALRAKGETRFIGATFPAPEVLSSATAAWLVRDTLRRPVDALLGSALEQRALLAWPVIREWRGASGVTLTGLCRYRDYPRLVLARTANGSTERLWLDPKTGFPVKLERREPHYLWGSVLVEYVWSNWQLTDGVLLPGSAFRMVEGETHSSSVTSAMALVPRDSAPVLALPDTALVQQVPIPAFLQPVPPDTVRVGPQTYLLRNRGYTHAVTLVRDTVFLFDATQADARSRADSSWIARLYPGAHPVVLVVTDLAWPHIAGVRFWVARGATVVSHRAAEPFLRRVVERRWTEAPDLLETLRAQRRAPRFRFRAVDTTAPLAGGDITLHAIDGITSEVALIAWLPADRFLWASDYIQGVGAPSEYLSEVRAAVRRAGVTPAKVAAQHLPLTPWSTVEGLYPAR